MKSHAIIPIFIPHRGCMNACAFCNQKQITAHAQPVSPDEVTSIIEKHLNTLLGRKLIVEIAFYGGSFTALPPDEQSAFLEIAAFYKRHDMVNKIRLSTRPDFIDSDTLLRLKFHTVDTIELGAQSFDDEVLRLANRGHDSHSIYQGSQLVQKYGFTLGLQLMTGLPGDTLEKAMFSARELVKINPEMARIYPTVVLPDTQLHQMVCSGEFTPLTLEESVAVTKEVYKIISSAGIKIIRVGLKSNDLINPESGICESNFHPAFRQLVEAEIAKEALELQLLQNQNLQSHFEEIKEYSGKVTFLPCVPVTFRSNKRSFESMIGNARKNRNYFRKKYPLLKISYEIDNTLADQQYLVIK